MVMAMNCPMWGMQGHSVQHTVKRVRGLRLGVGTIGEGITPTVWLGSVVVRASD